MSKRVSSERTRAAKRHFHSDSAAESNSIDSAIAIASPFNSTPIAMKEFDPFEACIAIRTIMYRYDIDFECKHINPFALLTKRRNDIDIDIDPINRPKKIRKMSSAPIVPIPPANRDVDALPQPSNPPTAADCQQALNYINSISHLYELDRVKANPQVTIATVTDAIQYLLRLHADRDGYGPNDSHGVAGLNQASCTAIKKKVENAKHGTTETSIRDLIEDKSKQINDKVDRLEDRLYVLESRFDQQDAKAANEDIRLYNREQIHQFRPLQKETAQIHPQFDQLVGSLALGAPRAKQTELLKHLGYTNQQEAANQFKDNASLFRIGCIPSFEPFQNGVLATFDKLSTLNEKNMTWLRLFYANDFKIVPGDDLHTQRSKFWVWLRRR